MRQIAASTLREGWAAAKHMGPTEGEPDLPQSSGGRRKDSDPQGPSSPQLLGDDFQVMYLS
jgi:hypothetical protein